MESIEPIIELCLRYDEQRFATANWSVARSWLAQGCDIEKDILPTMGRLMKRQHKGITSLSYFTRAILEAKQKRLDLQAVKAKLAEKSPADADTELGLMKRLAWLRAKTPHLLRHDHRDQLLAYEAKHGPVAP